MGGAIGGAAGACDDPVVVGRIEGEALRELSGIAASARNPGVFYVHNDSGDTARFFAIDEHGRTLAELVLEGAHAVDWEDITVGKGPGGDSFVYLGDVGDNGARLGLTPRASIGVYRTPEPLIALDEEPLQVSITDWAWLPLIYPAAAHDCEALLVDPVSSDLLLVTKENDGSSVVFQASGFVAADAQQTLEPVAQLAFGTPRTPGSSLVTGAAISPAGDEILLRTYSSVFLWQRPAGSTITEALRNAPRQLPAPEEAQGEAITFSADGSSYVTVSETEHSSIFRAFLRCAP